ncbi:white-brown complex-like protein [Actinidia rufa]|uniref:White-brown complex-like protein n=1 Tax=Actinidia rufa TaxID=165716 RepID=A0A7J0ESK8_9ERIC|nr:white-brown complex-like protein [Actinidia rufa]
MPSHGQVDVEKGFRNDGIMLTWEDLWVTVSDGKGNRRAIIQGLTGYARPGELLAIMGPSGCGKSTLLDTLAGRLGANTRQAGDILINGYKQALAYGTSAYVTQEDTLITTLTVKEAMYYSAQLQLPNSMSKSEKKERADMTIREMGLMDSSNTRIGGSWGVKGLSGGQKRRDIEQGSIGKKTTEEVIDILVTSFKSSDAYQEVRRQVSEICKQEGGAQEEKRIHAGFLTQCLVLTKRSSVNMTRDLGYYWLRLVIYIGLSIGVGTIYYNVGSSYNSIQARGAMLMFMATFLTFMAIGGFPSFVEDMKVFQRERLNGHYGSTAFVIGNTLSAMPYLLLISLIPGAFSYYLTGLQRGLDHFMYFVAVLFTCMMLVESLMMIVASLVPNFLMGIIAGSGIQGLMILGGGFFRLPNDLPKPFWKFPLHYIAFHRYAYQGLYKNEFEGLSFPGSQTGGRGSILGVDILRDQWQVQMGYSKWVDLGVLLGMLVFYRFMFLCIVKVVEKGLPAIQKIMSLRANQKQQIMENPNATPIHT